jgi:thioredoxin reductase
LSAFTFSFAGRPIAARTGQSLAAALAAAGEHGLRETRSGAWRGVFCGMGVCQECLVTVDGAPNQRACVVKARPGMTVLPQDFPGVTPEVTRGAAPISFADLPRRRADLLVIGAGAGGLNAAIAARMAGLEVLVVDERAVPGGQYFKQTDPALGEAPLDPQQQAGADLVARAVASGAVILSGTEVVTPLDATSVLATHAGRGRVLAADAMIVATGAYERAHVVPGWTLPGVMTTGAVQTLWRSHRVTPGRRLLVAGNGPLNLQVACEAIDAGMEVVAVVEAAPVARPTRWPALLAMALADPGLTADGLRLTVRAARGGAELLFGQVARRITRSGDGLAVEIGGLSGGEMLRFEVDVVALGYGFHPADEIARTLGVHGEQESDPQAGPLVIGDCAGLGGAPAAAAEGVLAATEVARRLGRRIPAELARAATSAAAALAGHRRFQAALWRLYRAPPVGLALADDATLVCRCEEVPLGRLHAALAAGASDAGQVKRATRCGMGRCQGRYCGPVLAALLADGRAPADRDRFAPRGPIKPVAIADLVGRP